MGFTRLSRGAASAMRVGGVGLTWVADEELALECVRDGSEQIEGAESVGLIGIEVVGLVAAAKNGLFCLGSMV